MRPIFAIFNFLRGLKTTKFHEVPAGTAVKMYGEDSNGDLIKDDVPSGGASAFTELSDVPESYTDQAGKMLIVNENEDALEFTDVPSGGALPEGTVDGSVLHWNDTEKAWEENSNINVYEDVIDGDSTTKQIDIIENEIKLYSWLSDDEVNYNKEQQIAFKFSSDSAFAYFGISKNFDTGESNSIYAGVYAHSTNGDACWQVFGRLKAKLHIAQTLTTENDLILCHVGGTNGIEVFKVSELGKILSNYLAGTGNRSLYADENGNITANTNAGLSGSCTIDGQTLTFENGVLVGASPALS